jgi:thiol:disulfide interchange protein DsbD
VLDRRRLLLIVIGLVVTEPGRRADAQPSLLPADRAFQIRQATRNGSWVEVDLWTAPGYALYAERIKVTAQPATVRVAAVELPTGVTRWDDALGVQLTYLRGAVRARVRLEGRAPAATLTIAAQGCADIGVCYPPLDRTFEIGALQ